MNTKTMMMGAALGALMTAGAAVAPAQAQDSIYFAINAYRTGPFAGSGIPIADGMRDYLTMLNERDGGIGGVKIIYRGVRDRLRHQEGRRVLRAGQVEEPGAVFALVDRHHAAAHPARPCRQDPDPVDGLWPLGLGRRRRTSPGSSTRR